MSFTLTFTVDLFHSEAPWYYTDNFTTLIYDVNLIYLTSEPVLAYGFFKMLAEDFSRKEKISSVNYLLRTFEHFCLIWFNFSVYFCALIKKISNVLVDFLRLKPAKLKGRHILFLNTHKYESAHLCFKVYIKCLTAQLNAFKYI